MRGLKILLGLGGIMDYLRIPTQNLRCVLGSAMFVHSCGVVQDCVHDVHVLVVYMMYMFWLSFQCGFGLTPVVIKKFAALSGANPLIFCLYR